MVLDLTKLNSFSLEVYHKIIEKHPEWERYAKHNEELDKFLVISIPAPISGGFNIDILTLDGEEEEITIHYGPPHIHLFMYKPLKIKTLDDQLEALEEIIQKIFNEELIAYYKKGFFFEHFSFITPKEYEKLLGKKRLFKTISWKGTYNYPSDSTIRDWDVRKEVN